MFKQQLRPTVDNTVLGLAIEQSREGIAIHDAEGRFLYINPAMASMYGYQTDEVLGRSWKVFYQPPQVSQIETDYFPVLAAAGHWRGELQGLRKNGEVFDVDISLTLLKDQQGNTSGLVCRSQDLSETKRTQIELARQQRQVQLVLDRSPLLIAYVGRDYRYQIVNQKYCEWTGKSADQIIGSLIESVLTETAFEEAKRRFDLVLSGQEMNFEGKVPHVSGNERWVNARYVPDRGSSGQIKGFYAFISDIDDRKRKEFDHQTLMLAVDRGIEGFALHDKDGKFTYVNPAQANMYGYEADELLGQSWRKLYDEQQAALIESTHLPELFSSGQWRGELLGLRRSGETFDVEVSLTLLKDELGDPAGLFCSCRDISERKRTQKELDFLAYHDHLTLLPNRLLFKERLELALIRAQRRNTMAAVLFIDLDHFKYVNDTLGHSIGDQLLQLVANRIRSVFRAEDTVSRLGGDEFTVLICDLTQLPVIDQIVNKLIQAFRNPIQVRDHEIYQGISVGISIYPRDGADVEALMKNADAAMYRAKEEGRQGYRYYIPSLTDCAYESMIYRTQLQNALDKDEFELHYQPLISLTENRVIGLEALIRWRHPELGLVFPDKFIRHAEECNLILPMGFWVIENVCQQIKTWDSAGTQVGKVAVNVSGIQLRSAFANQVQQILRLTETEANRLQIEITETFLMKGIRQPVAQLDQLRSLGISLAIDDFGVGYSSLSQLKQLPIQCLKIDRSFVGDIVEDLDDRAIVEAIIVLGKTLKLEITAEGVETAEQHELLKQLGCAKAQGYYYAKPRPAGEIPALVAELNQRLGRTRDSGSLGD